MLRAADEVPGHWFLVQRQAAQGAVNRPPDPPQVQKPPARRKGPRSEVLEHLPLLRHREADVANKQGDRRQAHVRRVIKLSHIELYQVVQMCKQHS